MLGLWCLLRACLEKHRIIDCIKHFHNLRIMKYLLGNTAFKVQVRSWIENAACFRQLWTAHHLHKLIGGSVNEKRDDGHCYNCAAKWFNQERYDYENPACTEWHVAVELQRCYILLDDLFRAFRSDLAFFLALWNCFMQSINKINRIFMMTEIFLAIAGLCRISLWFARKIHCHCVSKAVIGLAINGDWYLQPCLIENERSSVSIGNYKDVNIANLVPRMKCQSKTMISTTSCFVTSW